MATIPLAIQSPKINTPFENLSAAIQTQDMMAQLEQRRAQAAAQQAEADQRNRDLADQNIIQQAARNPALNAQLHAGDFAPLEGKVQPKTLDAIKASHAALQSKLLTNTKEENELTTSAYGKLNTAIAGLLTMPDLAAINASLPSTIQNLQSAGVFKDAKIDPSQLPQSINSKDDLVHFQAAIGGALAAHEQALTNQKTQAETSKLTADAQLAQQKADLQKSAIDQFKANPQAGGQLIDTILPAKLDGGANAAYKAAYQSAMQTGGPEAAQKIVEAAATHAAQISNEVNPVVMAGKAKQAGMIAQAEIPAKVAAAFAEIPAHVQQAVQTQLAQAKNSSEAFSGIVDPTERHRAEQGYEKASLEAATAIGDSKKLQDFVHAAQSGNKAAGGLIPLAEIRAITNRVNTTELKAAGAPGDIVDKGIGVLNGWANGVPISPEGLKAVNELADVTQRAVSNTYKTKVDVLNKTYGGKAKPIDIQTSFGGGGAKPGATGLAAKSNDELFKMLSQ